jgi:hypothetical protein
VIASIAVANRYIPIRAQSVLEAHMLSEIASPMLCRNSASVHVEYAAHTRSDGSMSPDTETNSDTVYSSSVQCVICAHTLSSSPLILPLYIRYWSREQSV